MNTRKSWAEIWEDLQSWEIPEPIKPQEWEITPQEWDRLQSGLQELADSLNPTLPQERGGGTQGKE